MTGFRNLCVNADSFDSIAVTLDLQQHVSTSQQSTTCCSACVHTTCYTSY